MFPTLIVRLSRMDTPFSPSCAIVREAFFLFLKWPPFLRVGFLDPQVKNKSQDSARQGKGIIPRYLPDGERENIIVLKVAEGFSYHVMIVFAQAGGLSIRRVYGKGETFA